MTISSGGPFYYNVYFVKYSDWSMCEGGHAGPLDKGWRPLNSTWRHGGFQNK